jgi:predicted ATPase
MARQAGGTTRVNGEEVPMLHLSRLGARDGLDIITGVTNKGKAPPDKIGEQILARTDGIPLFIEEVTNTLLESGLLHETPDRYTVDGPLPPFVMPTTLQASLVARLDRLSPVKDLMQIGPVIGREFSYELISAMAAFASADLDAALRQLISSGLISRRVSAPDATYWFKHAIVQDAANAMLLKSGRPANPDGDVRNDLS